MLFAMCAFAFQANAQYCDSMPSSNDGTGISELVVDATTFTSGGDITYEDFTGTAVDLQAGVQANVQITFATGYTYDTHIWIDFGDDDSFAEAGDLVYSGVSSATNPTTLDASFSMPAGAALGTHRMRIGTADSGQATPNPCYTGSYGVTMDLDVNITAAPSCLPPISLNATNITDDAADLGWTAGGTETLWNVELVTAGTAPTGTATDTGVSNPFSATGLTSNTTYEFYVQSDCGGETSGWSGPFAFTTSCSTFVPDYAADMSVNVPDACWDEAGSGDTTSGPMGLGASDWRQGTSYAYGSSNAINLFSNVDQEWLLSPSFDLSTGGPYQLDMNVAVTNWNAGTVDDTMGSDDEVQLLMSTDGGTTWSNLTTWNAANEPPVGGLAYVEDLTAITGNVQFAIYATDGVTDDTEDYDFHVGRFEVRAIPSCTEPSGLTATLNGLDAVDFSWTPGTTETQWTYEYGVSPYTQGGGGTSGTVMTDPMLALTGLTSGESYDIYIQSNCAGSDSVYITTSWTQPNLGESCSAPIMAAMNVDCSDAAASSFMVDFSTTTDIGPAGSCDTTTGNLGVWVEFTTPASGGIKLNNNGANNEIAIYDACAGTEVYCAALGAELSLSGFTPNTTYYAAIWKDSFQTLTTDTFCFEEVNCLFPTGLTALATSETTADLAWTAGASETAWEYVVQADGTGEPTGAGTAASVTSASVTGLMDGTAYEVYVRADCGGTFSDWFGPVDFTTPLTPIVPPYLNDFSTFPGDGWAEAGSGDPTTGPTGTTGDFISKNYANDAASANGTAAAINLFSNTDQEWLISPVIDLTTAGSYYLNMDVAVTAWNGTGTISMGSDDEVQVLITSDAGATWVNLITWNATNQPANAREAATEVDLSSYAGNNVQIAIWATDGAVDDTEDMDFFVDNFQVTTMPLSTTDVVFEGFKYFPNPTQGTLSLRAQDNIQAVSVINMLGQEVMRSAPNALSSELDMSDLQTGAYFIRVRINDAEENFRIIKQ